MEDKRLYLTPTMKIIDMDLEEPILQMSGIPDYGNGGDPLGA